MALGAVQGDVLKMILRMGLRLSVIGIVLGLIAATGATRAIKSQLGDISPHDPVTLIAMVLVITMVGLAGCYFPAKSATCLWGQPSGCRHPFVRARHK